MNAGIPGRNTGRAASLAAATTLLFAPALAAQDPAPPLGTPADAPETCACAWDFGAPVAPGVPGVFHLLDAPDRARIGVVLGSRVEVDGRTGIRIEGVAPDGPAADAGLREGDILLSLNGEAFGDEPMEAVLEALEDVDAGDTVTLTYSRDGAEQTATVVTQRAGSFRYAFGGDGAGVWRMRPDRVRRVERIAELAPLRRALAPDVRVRLRERLGGGLRLVPMNEGLGEYFDVSEGVLVADVDEDSGLGLRAGDVIVSIGGREVQDTAHARSIIASYRDDETIEFGIVRDGDRTTVTGTRDRR